MNDPNALEEVVLARQWFYPFALPSGRTAPCAIGPAGALHDTRERMLLHEIGRRFPEGVAGLSCLDLGCNEGFYSFAMARAGFGRVVAVDLQEENIAAATLLRDLFDLPQVSFLCADLESAGVRSLGVFDVVLLLGVVYHLEDPVGALRTARAATGNLCVVESQLAPEQLAPFPWGARRNMRAPVGSFSVLDATPDVVESPRYVHPSKVSLVPSAAAMEWLLPAVGFHDVHQVPAPEDGYEQMVSGDRRMWSCLSSEDDDAAG